MRRFLRRMKSSVYGHGVTVTQNGDGPALNGDGEPVRLRVNVYDALALGKGLKTVVAQARRHGVHRTTMFRLRSGERRPSLRLAMRIAADLGTDVEALFERVA
jgi:hypothetical protein